MSVYTGKANEFMLKRIADEAKRSTPNDSDSESSFDVTMESSDNDQDFSEDDERQADCNDVILFDKWTDFRHESLNAEKHLERHVFTFKQLTKAMPIKVVKNGKKMTTSSRAYTNNDSNSLFESA